MKQDGCSLRMQIEKWFGCARWTSIHISRASRTFASGARYGCVTVSQRLSPHVIVFFRHNDGSWQVYPPSVRQATLSVSHVSPESRACAADLELT